MSKYHWDDCHYLVTHDIYTIIYNIVAFFTTWSQFNEVKDNLSKSSCVRQFWISFDLFSPLNIVQHYNRLLLSTRMLRGTHRHMQYSPAIRPVQAKWYSCSPHIRAGIRLTGRFRILCIHKYSAYTYPVYLNKNNNFFLQNK